MLFRHFQEFISCFKTSESGVLSVSGVSHSHVKAVFAPVFEYFFISQSGRFERGRSSAILDAEANDDQRTRQEVQEREFAARKTGDRHHRDPQEDQPREEAHERWQTHSVDKTCMILFLRSD